jgi:transglycosylase-like protein with SLT domain
MKGVSSRISYRYPPGARAGPAKPTQPTPYLIMRKFLIYVPCLLLLAACENAPVKKADLQISATVSTESPLDREIKGILEKGISMGERKRQVTAIETAFKRRTTPERARQLAALCFTKTLGTPFLPFDLAEIALAETGGHQLSAGAVSSKGALGVWQLMPKRAKSHGYSPSDMENDEKCAEAAVRELYTKLEMAQGNLERAKKLYCGQGPQAEFYLRKVHVVRQEMLNDLELHTDRLAMSDVEIRTR